LIFVLVSFFLFLVSGCGILISLPAKFDSRRFIRPYLALASGTSFLYLLVLTGLSLKAVLIVSSILAFFGWSILAYSVKLRSIKISSVRDLSFNLIPCFLALLFLGHILGPLTPLEWDARSIFFFHSKMIFFNGALNGNIEWLTQPIGWSHVAYPKFIASLGALVATATGYWNESLPKISLLLILVPAFYGLAIFAELSIRYFVMVTILVLCTAGWWLWNGYADGFLVLYSTIGLLFLTQPKDNLQPENLLGAFVSGTMAAQCKNEGMLICLIYFIIVLLQSRANKIPLVRIFSTVRIAPLVFIVALLPTLLWIILRKSLRLGNDLSFGLGGLKYAKPRLVDSEPTIQIITALIWERPFLTMLFVVLGSSLIATIFNRVLWNKIKYTLMFMIVYFIAVYWIFLTTYWPLHAHLTTAADRVALILWGGLCVLYFRLFEPQNDSL
jgi:hypothetical protein